MNKRYFLVLLCCLVFILSSVFNTNQAQNPIIHDQFTADPTARLFGDSIYLYPSHDIIPEPGIGKPGWFNMKDYHVFASADLVHWRDGGLIISQYDVPWADTSTYSMWAPDCVERNGKYYFYFPAQKHNSGGTSTFGIGVAIGKTPTGPFVPEQRPISGVSGIDPNVLIDDDGQAYLYWAQGDIMGAKLKDNMLELDGKVHVLKDLPIKGLKEGPFVFKRDGNYYLTYPHVAGKTERLEYAMSNSPLGPFKQTGVIMDASDHCWTNHQSIVEVKGHWFLFYHSNDYSPGFDKARSVRIDSLFFNGDGTIHKVIPTIRGVGITAVGDTIQIDRYSAVSHTGATISTLDTTNRFKGWSLLLTELGAWSRYNQINFGKGHFKKIIIRLKAKDNSELIVRRASGMKEVLCRIPVQHSETYKTVDMKLLQKVQGVQDLIITEAGTKSVKIAIDWILFK